MCACSINWANPATSVGILELLLKKSVLWGHSDLWPPKSDQFILETKGTFVPNLKEFPPRGFWDIVFTRMGHTDRCTDNPVAGADAQKSIYLHLCGVGYFFTSLPQLTHYLSIIATKCRSVESAGNSAGCETRNQHACVSLCYNLCLIFT